MLILGSMVVIGECVYNKCQVGYDCCYIQLVYFSFRIDCIDVVWDCQDVDDNDSKDEECFDLEVLFLCEVFVSN